MSSVTCWQCSEDFAKDQVFDIPVFKKGFTIQWCFNCAMKQLEFSDYRLIKKPSERHLYKKFRVESLEDWGKRYRHRLEELQLCFEAQFRKVKDIDLAWDEFHNIMDNEINEDIPELDIKTWKLKTQK